jgi:WD40 repeat protein
MKQPDPDDSDAGEEPVPFMFSAGDDKTLCVWDLKQEELVETLGGHENTISAIATTSEDIFTASYDHNIMVWD